jgi:glutathione S-transferase
VPEHVIDDEGAEPNVRAWFDRMRDRHYAEKKAKETEPHEHSSSTPHRPS